MRSVKVNASRSYEVIIGSGILKEPYILIDRIKNRTVMIVADDTVYGLYGKMLESRLSEVGNRLLSFVFPHGEKSKNLQTYSELVEAMCTGGMTRSDVVIALGGGVTGDLAGFAAATYQRGIEFVQVPSSLLAAVDSSVGGKTGVDLAAGKNQVGAFYQPSKVVCDIELLKTLPEDEYRNGCAEVIKYAMIGNEELFNRLSELPVKENYEEVIAECISMKRDFVEQDEFDNGARMLLNFGHTVGHGVEACSNYTIPHGQAVAIGMAVITKASVELGYCGPSVYDNLIEILKKYELPFISPFSAEPLAKVMLSDKKGKGGSLTLVIPEKLGCCVLKKISKEEIAEWLRAGGVV